MRDHLLALTAIQQHLALEAYEKAAAVAKNRLGIFSLNSHNILHMARFMTNSHTAD